MKRRKRSQAEKDYWKIVNTLDRGRFLLERFCSSYSEMEEDSREELLEAMNNLDELSHRIYSMRFNLQESGIFEEEHELDVDKDMPQEVL